MTVQLQKATEYHY